MSHREYQNQKDYDSQTKKEVEEEEEKRVWWGASFGVVYLKYNTLEYMEENFDEFGGFSELIDCREEDKVRCMVKEEKEEENYYKCSDCDSWVKSTESCCGEEEEEDEELDICGEKGREFDLENPVKGCGKKITEDMENIMIGNISFCGPCGEVGMELWDKNEECPCGEGWVGGCGDPRCQPMSKEEEE